MLLQTTNAPSQYKASFLPARATAGIFEFNATLMDSNLDYGAEGKLHLPKQHHPWPPCSIANGEGSAGGKVINVVPAPWAGLRCLRGRWR